MSVLSNNKGEEMKIWEKENSFTESEIKELFEIEKKVKEKIKYIKDTKKYEKFFTITEVKRFSKLY